jgi:hypothetical protein
MAHGTDFPEHEGARATILKGDIVVYMPLCYFRSPVSTFLTNIWSQRNRSGFNVLLTVYHSDVIT